MKKFLVPALLIILLIGGLFVLTGCGDNKQENKEATNTTTSENTTSDANTNVQIEATEFYIQNLVPDTTIKSLSASVSGYETWTPNLLGELELATGTQAKIGLGLTQATSTWDIKATDEEGTEVMFKSIDLSSILENKGGSVALQLDENNAPVAVVK